MTEAQLQQQMIVYFNNHYKIKGLGLLFAVPNGGSRNIVEAKNLKATGVMPGVSDLILLMNNKCLFIEVKTESGLQSDKQKEFQSAIEKLGFEYKIIRNLNEFTKWISSQYPKTKQSI